MKIFDQPINLLGKVLDLTSERNNLISSNLANRDTPGYKAQDLAFESQLKKAYDADNSRNMPLAMTTTQPAHLAGGRPDGLNKVQGEVFSVFNPEAKLDGNTVDLDQEMSKLASNQLLYQAAVTMLSRKITSLRTAIEEGGR